MSSPLGVGVVGAGNMGADHARTLTGSVPGAEVRLVADLDRARAATCAEEIGGARVTDDPLALIADPDVDAVVVASHDSTHAGLVLATIAAGKPVLCEKPLAPTSAEAVDVLERIGSDGAALLSLGFMRRFDPGYVALRAAVDDGTVGRPLLVHCVSRGVASYPGTTSEGSVTGSAVHEFDIVPWLLRSEVVDVTWAAGRQTGRATGLQDPQFITLRTADGVLTTVEIFLNAGYGYDMRCEIVGETGAVSLAEPVCAVLDSARTRSTAYADDWRRRFADAYRLELQAWVGTIRTGAPSELAGGRDGLMAAVIADAVITSMHEGGRSVRIAEPAPAVSR